MSPLLAAAVTGHTKIVEYLINREDCHYTQRIDALELLGATYIDKRRDMMGGLGFWKDAMIERDMHKYPKPDNIEKCEAYNNTVEVRTLSGLNELIAEPDKMRMQALLLRERILGPAHPDTSYYIRYRGAVYADNGEFDRCIMLWMYALEMQQRVFEPLSTMTQSSFLSFAELFSFMMIEKGTKKPVDVDFKDMMAVLDRAIKEVVKAMDALKSSTQPDRDMPHFNRLVVIVMHLLKLLCHVRSKLTEEQLEKMMRAAYYLVKLDPRDSQGRSVLHLASSKETSNVGRHPVCEFPSVDVIQLILEVGGNANSLDSQKNTPLHIAAMNKPCKPEVIDILVDAGAHIDSVNADNKTPLSLYPSSLQCKLACPLNFITLQCLAARAIVKQGVPYKHVLSAKQANIIENHQPNLN